MSSNADNRPLIRRPGAWIPIAISLAALAFLVCYATIFGATRNTNGDEGAPARIFQLLMVAQLPIIAGFAFKWLPRRPKQSLLVLAMQTVAWIIPIVAVIRLENR